MWNDDLVRQNGKTIWFIESQYASLKKTFEQQKSKRTGHVEQKKGSMKGKHFAPRAKKANEDQTLSKQTWKNIKGFKEETS